MTRRTLCFSLLLLLASCGGSKRTPAIEDLSQHQDLSLFKLQNLRGTRDGDRLDAQAMFSDTSSMLTLEMHFAIGSPTRLDSGAWSWTRSNGARDKGNIAARSVTFLGGQDGPPSIGGVFDLVDAGGKPLYRVNIPVAELKR
jgi:hypothetical protein